MMEINDLKLKMFCTKIVPLPLLSISTLTAKYHHTLLTVTVLYNFQLGKYFD